MPPQRLMEPDAQLESDAIATMLEGLNGRYPDSHSDMTYCFRALLRMFSVERRTKPMKLQHPCPSCEGLGKIVTAVHGPGSTDAKTCPTCNGKRGIEERQ